MKRDKLMYWITTGLLSAGFLMSAFMYLSKSPELINNFRAIGFPLFFVAILGTAKLLGALAIINPWSDTLKEWAYAGYIFVLIGAAWTHIATQTPFIAPLIFLVLTGISYWFYKRISAVASK